MLISGVYALSVEILSTKNTISTSAVDIELKEYDQSGNSFSEDGKRVMPGDKIELVTKVHNLGIDCYIRAKLIYKIGNTSIAEADYIDGNYKSWSKKDEYYYYDSVLDKDGTIELFNEVEVPNNIASISSDTNLSLNIIVEAIQARNFDNNWDGIEIKESVNRTYDIDFVGDVSIIYENDTIDHIKLDDNFFGDLGNIVPGDQKSEVISIINNGKTKNKYYLSIDYDNLTDDEVKLLNKMEIVIKKENGESIAKGSLADFKNKLLGTYKAGEKENLVISLYLPKDADNDYSKLLTKIIFKFYLENLREDYLNPYTGDIRLDISITVFILSAIGFLTVLMLEKREYCEYRKNNKRKGEN